MNDETRAFFELLAMLLLDPRSGVLLALLAAAAVIDWRTRRIPNWLTVGGIGYALLVAMLVGGGRGAVGLGQAALGAGVGLLVLLPLYLLRLLGAGDVKLLAMAGAFLGPVALLHAMLLVLVAGGLLALLAAARGGALGQLAANLRFIAMCFLSPAAAGQRLSLAASAPSVGRMPFGVAIAAGIAVHVVLRHFGFA